MAIHLPPDILWFFHLSGSLFPHHIRALWWNSQLVAFNRDLTDASARPLFDHLVLMMPDHLPVGEIAARPIILPGASPVLARYVQLTSTSQNDFIFGFVSLSWNIGAQTGDSHLNILSLTRREREIALQLAAGHSIVEIAERTACSPNTTRNLLKSAMRKTGCRSQSELVHLVLTCFHIY